MQERFSTHEDHFFLSIQPIYRKTLDLFDFTNLDALTGAQRER